MGSLYFGYPDGSYYRIDEELLKKGIKLESTYDVPNYISRFDIPLSCEVECNMECDINVPLFEKLCGVDISHGKDISGVSLTLKHPYKDQVRKHRKKRINKKWAKRYGYVTKFKQITVDDVKFEDRQDGTFEFSGYTRGW